MGECLISRRGGESYKLPVLDENYPADMSVVESASGSATFQVTIAEQGRPADYTYQWYVNGSAVDGATSAMFIKGGLSTAATYNVYCEITNKAGTVTSRVAKLVVGSAFPSFTYSASNSGLLKDGGYNWRVKFYNSGTLKFTDLGNGADGIEIFCVGGGGAGGTGNYSGGAYEGARGGGGGGGFTGTYNASMSINTSYAVEIGGGGAIQTGTGGRGGTSCIKQNGVVIGGVGEGGYGGEADRKGGYGGSGGGAGAIWGLGGAGGSGGNNGGGDVAGAGQGATTHEFGEDSGEPYAGGGGGGSAHTTDRNYNRAAGGAGGGGAGGLYSPIEETDFTWAGIAGTTNLGGGGGGCGAYGSVQWDNPGGAGGSGIVIIRNKRS